MAIYYSEIDKYKTVLSTHFYSPTMFKAFISLKFTISSKSTFYSKWINLELELFLK
jgi:hypothetical protein